MSFELLSGIVLAFVLTSLMVPGAMASDANNVNNSSVQNQPPEVSGIPCGCSSRPEMP